MQVQLLLMRASRASLFQHSTLGPVAGITVKVVVHLQVRLVVIDSIAFHFRQGTQGMADRSRLLAGLSQQLLQQAEARDVAVRLPAPCPC